jgi:hypothetical protein
MRMRLAIAMSAAVMAVVCVLPAQAQRGFARARGFGGARGSSVHMHMHGPFRGGERGHRGHPHYGYGGRGHYYNRAGYFAAPYFYPPDFYADDYEEPPASEAPPAQVVVVQAPAPSPQAPPAPPAESLVLELHGNHWVRITDSGETEVDPENSQPGSIQAASRPSAEAGNSPPARALPPAVLVFRDGHQEQTRKYTIIGPMIYTSTDYWVGGSWRRKIPMSELDVAATLRLNQERGVRFELPSAPNVVVVRP